MMIASLLIAMATNGRDAPLKVGDRLGVGWIEAYTRPPDWQKTATGQVERPLGLLRAPIETKCS